MMKDIISKAGSPVKYLTYAIYAIVIIVIAVVVFKILQAAKAGAAVAGDIAGHAIIAAQTGISASRQVVCENVAQECSDGTTIFLHTVLWVSNDQLINALNELVSADEGKLTSQYYKQKTGFGLKSILHNAVLLDTNRINADVFSGIQ